MLEEKKKIMGFGHGVYKIQDPRSPVVKSWVEKLISDDEAKLRFEIAKKIDEIMDKEKKLFPNVDFYGGLLLSELDFDVIYSLQFLLLVDQLVGQLTILNKERTTH